MRIIFGGTRIVLVFSNYVVKIPRIFRVSEAIKSFLKFLPEKKVLSKLKSFHKNGNLIKAAFNFIFLYGFIANRNEYLYSQKNKNDNKIIHVYGFLYYFIIIQKRENVLDENNPYWKKYESSIKKEVEKIFPIDPDLTFRNFCNTKEGLKLIDYGNFGTLFVLENHRTLLP